MNPLKIERFSNNAENFPTVSIQPKESFASKLSPTFESDIFDGVSNEKIGHITFKLRHEPKIMVVEDIIIARPKQGYGVSLYRTLQAQYPEYRLISSGQMKSKDSDSQEKPNAVYLWEKLVSLGFAEEDREGGFRMKK
jgi:hypothetical protein